MTIAAAIPMAIRRPLLVEALFREVLLRWLREDAFPRLRGADVWMLREVDLLLLREAA